MATCSNPDCSIEFDPKPGSTGKFCSRSCATTVRNRNRQPKRKSGVYDCLYCGVPVRAGNRYCSSAHSVAHQYPLAAVRKEERERRGIVPVARPPWKLTDIEHPVPRTLGYHRFMAFQPFEFKDDRSVFMKGFDDGLPPFPPGMPLVKVDIDFETCTLDKHSDQLDRALARPREERRQR